MKLHPSNSPVLGTGPRLNRFIFGDALDEQGLEPCEYIIHTEAPAFVCRLGGNDHTDFDGREQETFSSALMFDEGVQAAVYVCNRGFRLYDFNFVTDVPVASVLQGICDQAMTAYFRLQEIYREQESGGSSRPMRTMPATQLSFADRAHAVAELKRLACDASEQPEHQELLATLVRRTLAAGDPAVFTEAQLDLSDQSAVRDLLLQTARDCIAFPDVMRADGSRLSFDLWGLPLVFSLQQGQSRSHFPLLERLEPILAKAFELAEETALWVSPTVFTLDSLRERGCQDLVYLAEVMEDGCDYAPHDPERQVTPDAGEPLAEASVMVAFIPILVEHGALSLDQARRCGRKALEAAMPLIQEAISNEMPYGEAELCAPLPWWDALAAGIGGVNRKRLGATLARLALRSGGSAGVFAVADYKPDIQGYGLSFYLDASEAPLARTEWLLTADIAPDKQQAWNELSTCFREAGIVLTERFTHLH
jgi:hypothetical protein